MDRFLRVLVFLGCLIGFGLLSGAPAHSNEPLSDYEYGLILVEGDTQQFPNTYQGRMALARALRDKKFLMVSLDLYQNLLEDFPNNPDVLVSRGFVYFQMQRFSQARQDFKRVIQSEPNYADGWYGLGRALRRMDRSDSALAAYNRAIELDPNRSSFYLARGQLHQALGHDGQARDDFLRAESLGADPETIASRLRALEFQRKRTPWEVHEGYEYTSLSGGRDSWQRVVVLAQRQNPYGTFLLELAREERGNVWNSWGSVEGYVELWKGSYLRFRYGGSPQHDFLPKNEYFGEWHQNLGRGWGVSGFYEFEDHNLIDVASAGGRVSKYYQTWFVRLSAKSVNPDRGASGLLESILIRNYFWGNRTDYLQLSAGYGEDVEPLVTGPTAGALDVSSVGIAARKYLTDHVGVQISAYTVNTEQIPTRSTLAIRFLQRW